VPRPSSSCPTTRTTGLFDHTSQLRFLEKVTGVREPNISDWRRTVGDLTAAFRFDDARKQAPTIPDTIGRYNRAQYEAGHLPMPKVPTYGQQMPHQEQGKRPHVK
jgi:phospholipase C